MPTAIINLKAGDQMLMLQAVQAKVVAGRINMMQIMDRVAVGRIAICRCWLIRLERSRAGKIPNKMFHRMTAAR